MHGIHCDPDAALRASEQQQASFQQAHALREIKPLAPPGMRDDALTARCAQMPASKATTRGLAAQLRTAR
jgi:hypothetical protein